ncbi:hypothetical protein H6503_04055 [Candidatus Woesearchaeota archaeon]|nr:hypothetical protein [Candidatus Woesearchaeota archaeon]
MRKDTANKAKVRELRKKSRYHDAELRKIGKEESKIMKKEGFEEKSHVFIWLLAIIAIIVAVVWFFLVR